MNSVENGVQAKSVIENFLFEGYEHDHIHVFANSNERAENIADFFKVDSGATPDTSDENSGFFESIKNFFKTTPKDLDSQLAHLGLNPSEQEAAQKELDAGKLVIIAHKPPTT